MKIAACVSGTIRWPMKSLESIEKLKRDGDEVDVYLHCWENVDDCIKNSWSHIKSEEPYEELIDKYNAVVAQTEDWMERLPALEKILADWLAGPLLEYKMASRVGMLGQYDSLRKAFNSIKRQLNNYDMIIRLRFDTLLIDNPLDFKRDTGFVVPAEMDFGGMNDQLAWYWTNKNNEAETERTARLYFDLFGHMDYLIHRGAPFHPETLAWINFNLNKEIAERPEFKYTIH